MSLHAVNILEIKINTDSKESILEYIQKYLNKTTYINSKSIPKQSKSLLIVTPNPEQTVFANRNNWFKEILNQADISIPDGTGLVQAIKFLSPKANDLIDNQNISRIAGVDFMEDLVRLSLKEGVRIGLIGGFSGLAVNTLECLKEKYPLVSGFGIDSPDFTTLSVSEGTVNSLSKNNDLKSLHQDQLINQKLKIIGFKENQQFFTQLVHKIYQSNAQIIFIGLGAPEQEWVGHILKQIINQGPVTVNGKPYEFKKPMVIMVVGGAFDVISGQIKRAPVWIRNIGFEWFWRLLMQPWRIKRQLALIEFVWRVIFMKIKLFIQKI